MCGLQIDERVRDVERYATEGAGGGEAYRVFVREPGGSLSSKIGEGATMFPCSISGSEIGQGGRTPRP